MCLNFEGHLCKRGLSIEGAYCTMPAHDVSFANRPYTGFVGRAVFSGRLDNHDCPLYFCLVLLLYLIDGLDDWSLTLHTDYTAINTIWFEIPHCSSLKVQTWVWCICFNANQRRHRASQHCLILFLFGCKCAFCEAKKAKQ